MSDNPKEYIVPSSGDTYEATYLAYVDFLHELAVGPCGVVKFVPVSWVPLVEYFGHKVASRVIVFEEDTITIPEYRRPVGDSLPHYDVTRRIVEIASSYRPELVHALYEWDTKWCRENAYARAKADEHQAIQDQLGYGYMRSVTGNACFFRSEFQQYRNREMIAPACRPENYLILVPCAAHKPYPAPLHDAVQKTVYERCFVCGVTQMVVTGVLGVVPRGDWDMIPAYDSGLPNQWNVYTAVRDYFLRFPHEPKKLIVYCDFYQDAIRAGLTAAKQSAQFPFYWNECMGYADLLGEKYLRLLGSCVS